MSHVSALPLSTRPEPMRHRVYRTGEHTRARSACVPVVRTPSTEVGLVPNQRSRCRFCAVRISAGIPTSDRARFSPFRDSNQQLRAEGTRHPTKKCRTQCSRRSSACSTLSERMGVRAVTVPIMRSTTGARRIQEKPLRCRALRPFVRPPSFGTSPERCLSGIRLSGRFLVEWDLPRPTSARSLRTYGVTTALSIGVAGWLRQIPMAAGPVLFGLTTTLARR